ncbi:MAG: glycosyltransferase family 2 protein [Candidatus Kapaibacterium sp.]
MSLITIITVVYNSRDMLRETIESVKRQSFRDFDYIVVDGGSSDGTLDVIKDNDGLITKWISEPDSGIYDAMNKGMKLAGESHLLFLNAGDVFSGPDVLESASPYLDGHDVVYGDIYVEGIKKRNYLKAKDFTLDNIKKYDTGTLCHQAMFVRKSKAPEYDAGLRYKAELNWYIDLLGAIPRENIIHIGIPVVNYKLGGKGYNDFLRNRAELAGVFMRRFGICSIFNINFIIRQLKALKWRYLNS